jgi:serine/threonine protein kinase
MNKGHYAEEDAAVLISKLLVGLVYLHSMNVMHRDIKPENLILKEEDGFDLKLADFGLAEYVNQKQHLFKRCGTPGYVAPEILDDMPYDTKVDIFSAGVILYILYYVFS